MRRGRAGWAGAAGALLLTLAAAGVPAQPATPSPAPVSPAPDWSVQAQRRLLYGSSLPPAEALARRAQLLADAQGLLQAGLTADAQAKLDEAAMLLHAGDTEAAQVRALMQAGDYRRALAFGAHAAGAHARDWPAGQALYLWLLQVGGQGRVAQRMLADALDRAPDDAALLAAQQAWQQPWPLARGPLLQPPLRVAPEAVAGTDAPPPQAAVAGTAVLLADGRAALMPLAVLDAAADPATGVPRALWLRNGLGQARHAVLRQRDEVLGIAVLDLDTPLPAPDWWRTRRAPFGGSPGAVTEYAPDATGQPAWPLLRQGFFGRVVNGPRPLGIGSPPGPRGGPVFDQAGALAGLALPGTPGQPDRLLSVDELLADHAALLPPPSPDGPAPRAEADAVYETALRATLQVLLQR